jgi:capsular exopolysaccharide synthesis family protein
LLSVSVEDTDAVRAAEVANLLIDVLIERNQEIQTSQFAASEESLQSQIEVIKGQIDALQLDIDFESQETRQTRIDEIDAQILELQSEIVELQLEINQIAPRGTVLDPANQSAYQEKQLILEQRQGTLDLFQQLLLNLISADTDGNNQSTGSGQSQGTMALYQQIYASLLSNYENIRLARLENTPSVVKVEPARAETMPIRPRPVTNSLLGLLVGLMIGAGIVFAIEYMDDTVKSPQEVIHLTSQPVIGYIPEIENTGVNGNKAGISVYVESFPRSPIAEAFRSLRTNLEFANAANPIKSILVTSVDAGDGKTTVVTNLASSIVQGGKRALILDADLRRPTLHKQYGIENRVGLSEYFRGLADIKEILKPIDKAKNLLMVSSGKIPPNPAELLASNQMEALLSSLAEYVDYIIVDSAPLTVADSLILSSKIDGVLLVIRPDATKTHALANANEQLTRANARIIGSVFNMVKRQSSAYYYPNYYSAYYSGIGIEESERNTVEANPSKSIPKGK